MKPACESPVTPGDRAATSNGKAIHNAILLIGNGPSTRELHRFGFKNLPPNVDTFGMGAAYRYYARISWWPTYYAWCDIGVLHSHRAALARVVSDTSITTKKFYFPLPTIDHPRLEQVNHSSTGEFCFRKAVELGYTKIYIIGVDGSHGEELAESRPLTEEEFRDQGFGEVFEQYRNTPEGDPVGIKFFRESLRIVQRTPESNPNYFFDDYLRVGDVYSLPRSQTERNASRKSVRQAVNPGIEVFNVSPSSQVRDYSKLAWPEFLREIAPADPALPESSLARRPLETPSVLSESDRAAARATAGLSTTEPLATLVIGFKASPNDPTRLRNLRCLLLWIERYYGNLFDVLLVEQGAEPTLGPVLKDFPPGVRHEFLFNPEAYNRGWGYNAAVRHFTHARVVALLDTDVLPSANFVQEVIDCHRYYKVVTPYMNVYFTNERETSEVLAKHTLEGLRRSDGVKVPTTITGGIVIIQRNLFEELVGFEQYIEYAGEDRALDVTILNHCAPADIRLAPYTYAHLHHPRSTTLVRARWQEIFTHLRENYGCSWDPKLTPDQNIHRTCCHVSREVTLINMAKRRSSYGDLDLYRSGRPLSINGSYVKPPGSASAIFPPAFNGLERYESNEVHKAPDPDSKRLALLHNAYRGKRCFIIGNGPSLNRHDLSLLQGEYSFAVNSFFYKTDETGFRPTFYVVEDSSVMKENIERIRAYEAPLKFFPTIYKKLHPPGDNVHFFRMNRGFYEKSSPNYCVPRFSTDASKVLYCGQSVTYINLQLAFFMGFTEVYLIGMDFDYVIPVEHQRTGDLILSTTDDPNHFHKDYFGKGKTWKDPKLERVALNYRQAKLAFEAVGRKIFNATVGGRLELFERVDYNSLLRGRSNSKEGEEPRTVSPVELATSSDEVEDTPEHKEYEKVQNPKYPAAKVAAPLLGDPNTSTAMRPSMLQTAWRRHGLNILEGTSAVAFCAFLPLALLFMQSRLMWPWGWAALTSAVVGGASLAAILHEIFHRARMTKAAISDLHQSQENLARAVELGDTSLVGEIEALRRDTAEALAAEIAKISAAVQAGDNAIAQAVDVLRERVDRQLPAAIEARAKLIQAELRQEIAELANSVGSGDEFLKDAIANVSKSATREIESLRSESVAAAEAQRANLETKVSEALRSLNAAIESAMQSVDAKAAALTSRVAAEAQERDAALKAEFIGTKDALNTAIGNAIKASEDQTSAVRAELASEILSAKSRSDTLQNELRDARLSLDSAMAKLATTSDTKVEELRAALGDMLVRNTESQNELKKLQESQQRLTAVSRDLDGKLQNDVAAIRTALEKERQFSNYGNAPFIRVHNRHLSEMDIEKIRKDWLRQLGLSLPPRQLHYLAHQICLSEERSEGRMATTIQAAVLRTLVLLSLQAKKIELLEIGTLFGVASGTLYRAALRAESQVNLTIIDPLSGYYNQGLADEQTGVPVTRKTLLANLASMGVPAKQYRIIAELSSSPKALKTASDRTYDFLLIDGDHSLEGVASDFQLYGPLVKPGGVIIFDDYGNKTWPAIQPFVDEQVRPSPDWLWIGAEWGTAVLRRKRQKAQSLAPDTGDA